MVTYFKGQTDKQHDNADNLFQGTDKQHDNADNLFQGTDRQTTR